MIDFGKAPAFDIGQGDSFPIAKQNVGVVQPAGVKGRVGGQMDDVVVIHFKNQAGFKGLVEPGDGIWDQAGQGFDFWPGVGKAVVGNSAIPHLKLVAALGKDGGQYAQIALIGDVVEIGQAGGGDVVDAVALNQPVVAVVQGGQGHVAQPQIG